MRDRCIFPGKAAYIILIFTTDVRYTYSGPLKGHVAAGKYLEFVVR